ncbi:MAG: FAD:protein FMN transferase [Oscillibacter sp.]|jgi:thiamine biosynthesis lipoprotein|nr:FAD:protein FMN transferase [Oscillibacter sp.]
MKKILSMIVLAAVLCALAGCAAPAKSAASSGGDGASAEIFAMDTVMDLTAYGDNGETALKAAEEKINALEDLLSRTREDSEISKLNAAGGQPVEVDPEAFSLISRAQGLGYAVDSTFNITIAPVVSAWGFTTDHYQVPSQAELSELLTHVDLADIELNPDGTVALKNGASIDLGGIAKGYASDCVSDIFTDNGITSGKISLGGNVYVCGGKVDGTPWRVAVQDPKDETGWVGVLKLKDAFAVTSGGYQRYFEENGKRYHHIIDPATGYPAESGLVSVTVVANAYQTSATGSGTMCDAYSTAFFVMGADKALNFWRSNQSKDPFDLVLVTEDNRVLVTSGLADEFEENEGSDYTYEIVR